MKFLQYICWDVNVHLSLNLNIMDVMDIVIDICLSACLILALC